MSIKEINAKIVLKFDTNRVHTFDLTGTPRGCTLATLGEAIKALVDAEIAPIAKEFPAEKIVETKIVADEKIIEQVEDLKNQLEAAKQQVAKLSSAPHPDHTPEKHTSRRGR